MNKLSNYISLILILLICSAVSSYGQTIKISDVRNLQSTLDLKALASEVFSKAETDSVVQNADSLYQVRFLRLIDASGQDTSWFYDDGDTLRLISQNPFKVNKILLDSIVTQTITVVSQGGDTTIVSGYAVDVKIVTTNFDNNLSTADSTLQAALETLDDLVIPIDTDDQTAVEVPTNTDNFNNNLSVADSDVQKALDTIDNISITDDQTAAEVAIDTLNYANQLQNKTIDNVQKLAEWIDENVNSGAMSGQMDTVRQQVAKFRRVITAPDFDPDSAIVFTLNELDADTTTANFYVNGEGGAIDELGRHTLTNGLQVSSPVKFGNYSVRTSTGDGIQISGNMTDFDFGNYTNFTLEYFVRFSGLDVTGASGSIQTWRFSAASGQLFVDVSDELSSGQNVGWHLSFVNNSGIVRITTYNSVTNGVWYHVAVVKEGGNGYFFVNGNQLGTTQDFSTLFKNPSGVWINSELGDNGHGALSYYDELRFTPNVAKWNTNFTPPTVSYGDEGLFAGKLRYKDGFDNEYILSDRSEDIKTTTTNFDNNLSVADNTVQKALETLDELVTGAGTASGVSTNTTNFNGALSPTEDDVQKALDVLDDDVGTNTSNIATNTSNINTKADSSNVLKKDNVAAFTPTGDYQPATKKYVDDNAGVGNPDTVYAQKIILEDAAEGFLFEVGEYNWTDGTSTKNLVATFTDYGDGPAEGSFIRAKKARGTKASPTAVQADDYLFSVSAMGHNGTRFQDHSGINIAMHALENFTNTNRGTYFVFNATPAGDTVNIPIATLNKGGTGVFDVVGDVTINGTPVSSGGGGSSDVTGYVDAYSTTEYKTNKYNTDGRPIYRKIINFGTLPNATSKDVATGISSIGQVIKLDFLSTSATNVSSQNYTGSTSDDNNEVNITYQIGSNTVRATTAIDWSGSTGYIVMEYTKTTDGAGTIPTGLTGANGIYVDSYSTTEYKTNKYFTDGRPIYRKVVSFGALPNNTLKSVNHNITNVQEYVSWSAYGQDGTQVVHLPHVHQSTISFQIYAKLSSTQCQVETATDYSSITTCYFIIEYTKSTDGAGSTPTSIPGTIGGLDYAAAGTEQSLGYKWIDNKVVYRKVINVGSLPNNTTKNVAHGITFDTVIDMFGRASSAGNVIGLPFTTPVSPTTNQVACWNDGTNIVLQTGSDRTGFTGYVVMLYTK